jgi:hypothetical protein
MPWLESIGLTMVQNADDVACLAAPLVILHHKLGRVCKLGSDPYTIRHEPRRLNQRPVGATAAAAPTPKTHDWPACRGPSPHP